MTVQMMQQKTYLTFHRRFRVTLLLLFQVIHHRHLPVIYRQQVPVTYLQYIPRLRHQLFQVTSHLFFQ